jgi:hypothetical protein
MLLIRLLPWLTALFAFVAAQYQWTHLLSYPLPLVIWFVWFVFAILLIRWSKVSFRATFEKMTPAVFAAAGAILAFLMAQDAVQRLGLTLALVLLSWVTLELFFYYAYDPKRYPVNALSHVNLALVPLIVFYCTCGLSGLQLFLQIPWWLSVVTFIFLGAILFALTEHPVADLAHRIRWRGLGMWIGAQASLLLLFLPVTVSVRGALLALLFFVPLRVRRYAYAPRPSTRVSWLEGGIALALFVFVLLTAQWA